MKKRVRLSDRLRIIINGVVLYNVQVRDVPTLLGGAQLEATLYCIKEIEEYVDDGSGTNCTGFAARYRDVDVQVNLMRED